MTNTISQAIRTQIHSIIENSNQYDASTMRIYNNGMVTAKISADKTHDCTRLGRYNVGFAAELIKEDNYINGALP